ncbi:type II toxin-antitoxin system VapC family toxin [Cryobacterium aureum]|nr:type II toxin-antitoxin system VapC family toxin [Cryobacterium aureum]
MVVETWWVLTRADALIARSAVANGCTGTGTVDRRAAGLAGMALLE